MSGHLQRVVSRAVRLQKHIVKRYEAKIEAKEKWDYEESLRQENNARRVLRRMHKSAKKEHREDWLLGPLAPRRDVGVLKSDLGVMPQDIMRRPPIVKGKVKELVAKARSGKPRNVFMLNDRVVVIRGVGKGTVGKIHEISWATQTASLENVLSAYLNFPPYAAKQAADQAWDPKLRHIIGELGVNVPFEDLRLVMRLPGGDEDVIVDCMDIPEEYNRIEEKDDDSFEEIPRRRLVHGTNIEIKTKAQPEDRPATTWYAADTYRDGVDARTYIPELASVPFPPSVLEEFRHPMSKSNTRLPAKYVEKLRRKDAREEIREAAAKEIMLDTPGKELQRSIMEQVREQRPEMIHAENRELTDASIDKLAEYMAKHLSTGATLPTIPEPISAKKTKPKWAKGDKSFGRKKRKFVKFSTKPKNDGWKATKGKMATKSQKLESNKTFARIPLRLRRKKPLDKKYDMRGR